MPLASMMPTRLMTIIGHTRRLASDLCCRRSRARALAEKNFPRPGACVHRWSWPLGATECPDQLRGHFAAKSLDGRFHIPGAIHFCHHGAHSRVSQPALVDAGIIHFSQQEYVRTQPPGSRIHLYRSCARDFHGYWDELLLKKLPISDDLCIAQRIFQTYPSHV